MIDGCTHRPLCAVGTTRWVCCKRTEIEAAASSGVITPIAARALLATYHVPMTPPSRVYKGEPRHVLTQESLT